MPPSIPHLCGPFPEVAEAFTQERITASHANLIARLPQESQAEAFEQCWRKDWQDSEPHLLPAKHVSAWIQSNLYPADGIECQPLISDRVVVKGRQNALQLCFGTGS